MSYPVFVENVALVEEDQKQDQDGRRRHRRNSSLRSNHSDLTGTPPPNGMCVSGNAHHQQQQYASQMYQHHQHAHAVAQQQQQQEQHQQNAPQTLYGTTSPYNYNAQMHPAYALQQQAALPSFYDPHPAPWQNPALPTLRAKRVTPPPSPRNVPHYAKRSYKKDASVQQFSYSTEQNKEEQDALLGNPTNVAPATNGYGTIAKHLPTAAASTVAASQPQERRGVRRSQSELNMHEMETCAETINASYLIPLAPSSEGSQLKEDGMPRQHHHRRVQSDQLSALRPSSHRRNYSDSLSVKPPRQAGGNNSSILESTGRYGRHSRTLSSASSNNNSFGGGGRSSSNRSFFRSNSSTLSLAPSVRSESSLFSIRSRIEQSSFYAGTTRMGHDQLHFPLDRIHLTMDHSLRQATQTGHDGLELLHQVAVDPEVYENYHVKAEELENGITNSLDSLLDMDMDGWHCMCVHCQACIHRQKHEPPLLPPLHYVLSVPDDLYQRTLDEIVHAVRMPFSLFYCGHHEDVSRPSIGIAAVVLLVLFMGMGAVAFVMRA